MSSNTLQGNKLVLDDVQLADRLFQLVQCDDAKTFLVDSFDQIIKQVGRQKTEPLP